MQGWRSPVVMFFGRSFALALVLFVLSAFTQCFAAGEPRLLSLPTAAAGASPMQDDAGLTIDALRVDGGLTGSRTLMQIQANLLGKPVEVLENPEATAFGTCALAARAAGLWADDDTIRQQVRIARTYTPQISEDERQAFLKRFDRAVRHLEAWHRDE